ncbi:hypothetical protein LguiB_031725 [Lonicera macranthoides]
MTRDNPMTASERQRKKVKHVAKTGLKMYGKRRNPASTAPIAPLPALPAPLVLPPTRHAGEEPSAAENPDTEMTDEGEDPSGEGQEDDDGGPRDKSVLISFNDHIAYAIWNKEDAGR